MRAREISPSLFACKQVQFGASYALPYVTRPAYTYLATAFPSMATDDTGSVSVREAMPAYVVAPANGLD